MHLAARVLLAVLALALQAPIEPFDPVRHASLDNSWTLEIDPVERHGAGPADYRCLHAGEVAWQGRLPFALDDVRVTDDGFVVGCANTDGRDAWEGELLVVRITPAGSARVCAVTPKRGPSSLHGPSLPRVRGVTVFAEPAHFRVHLDGVEASRQTSWAFALADGERVPKGLFGPVRERSPWLDREWTPEPNDEPRPVGTLASLDVREISVLRAEPLADVRLDTAVPRSSGHVCFSGDGSIAVFDSRSGAFDVHDARGRLRASSRLDIGRLSLETLDAVGDGWVAQDRRFSRARAWLHVDGRGTLVESRSRELGVERELPVTGSKPRLVWRIHERGVELCAASGATKHRVERGPDRRWFRLLSELLVLHDGGAVVIEDGRHDPNAVLHVFAPDGGLVWSLGLPTLPWRPRVSTIRGIVFVPAGDDDVLAIDTRTRRTWRVTLGSARTLLGCAALLPSPDGRELWSFAENAKDVARFALPEELR